MMQRVIYLKKLPNINLRGTLAGFFGYPMLNLYKGVHFLQFYDEVVQGTPYICLSHTHSYILSLNITINIVLHLILYSTIF